MTNKWITHAAVPKSVLSRELEFNKDNWITAFDKLFDDTFRVSFPEFHKSFGIDPFSKTAYPKVNVVSHEDSIEIQAEIAGYNKEDISVEIEEDVLSIVGKASQLNEQTDKSVYLLRELKRSAFNRSFKLSEQLDAEKIDATFKDGLLTLVIPRKAKTIASKINKVTIK